MSKMKRGFSFLVVFNSISCKSREKKGRRKRKRNEIKKKKKSIKASVGSAIKGKNDVRNKFVFGSFSKELLDNPMILSVSRNH